MTRPSATAPSRSQVLDLAYRALASVAFAGLKGHRRYRRDAAMGRERAGYLEPASAYRAAPARIWLHGSSVGEISALPPILAELRRARPELGIALTAFTDTGLDAARRLVGAGQAFALPADLPGPLARAFGALAPDALILTETELWPGLLHAAARNGVPVAVVNGRLRESGFRRYAVLKPLLRESLGRLVAVAAQSAGDAERFALLGVPHAAIQACGSSKIDAQPWDVSAPAPAPISGRPVVVAGSTREGDEEIVLAAMAALASPVSPLLVLAPRHLPRLERVETLVLRRGLKVARRGAHPGSLAEAAATAAANGVDVLLLDTLGELAAAYTLSWVAIVGGGFKGDGGHNLLEPAVRARAVVFGPRQQSTAGEVDLLVAGGGGMICANAQEVAAAVRPLVVDEEEARARGIRARAAVEAARGAARRAVDLVLERLGPALDPARGAAPDAALDPARGRGRRSP